MKRFTLGLLLLASLPAAAQWTTIPTTSTGKLEGIHFIDSQKGFIGGAFVSIAKTTDGGTTWSGAASRPAKDFSFFDNTHGYAASAVGYSMSRTQDGGATWTAITPVNSNSLWAVAATSPTTAYFAGTGGVLWVTSNGGNSFLVLNSGTTQLITDVVFTSPTTGFTVDELGSIRKTTNSGATWTLVHSGGGLLSEMHFVNANTGFVAGTAGKVFKTTDGGTTWTQLTTNSSSPLEGIHFYDENHGIAVGFTGTILYTSDGGATWNSEISGTTAALYDVRMLSPVSAVVVGDGGTILKNSQIISSTADAALPNPVSVFPNPATDKINFSADQEIGSVTITDVAGRTVSAPFYSNGSEYSIDLQHLTAGIYQVSIQTTKGIVVKKIVKN